jgi:hypothetical protein
MNDKWMSYRDISDVYMDYSIGDDDIYEIMNSLVKDYDNITMDDWFEDEPIVEKKIPEFNFVK